ncbi:hypothetical protein SLA2020_104060 [Shorea laevis]
MSGAGCFNPVIQLKIPSQFRAQKRTGKFRPVSARPDDSQERQQQLNLSVLRFTFGIPGLDESYLPRWIGYGFGSLLILNRLLGADSATSAQLRSEALGLSLAAFSIGLPYIGKYLKGASPVDQTSLPEGAEQIFVMSQNVSDALKEDLAWATYVLLRNTNTTAVLISIQGKLCIRGYWNIPDGVSKAECLDWFKGQIGKSGLIDLTDTLYFPQSADSGLGDMLPKGTRSLLVQPVIQESDSGVDKVENKEGFVLLVSSVRYAYGDKDRAWIRAISKKFRG